MVVETHVEVKSNLFGVWEKKKLKKHVVEHKQYFTNGMMDSNYTEHLNLEANNFNEKFEVLQSDNEESRINYLNT